MSIHQKLALLLHKCKSHSTERVNFAASSILMSHNIGHYRGSLLNVFGWMTHSISKCLERKDGFSIKSASRKHRLEAGTTTHHRRKVSVRRVRGNVRRGWGKHRGASERTDGVNVGEGDSGNGGQPRRRGEASERTDGVNVVASGSGIGGQPR